jgi:hypothetical protein
MGSNWDRDLPDLMLDKVGLHAGSMKEAWKNLSTDHLARSVLVSLEQALEKMPFDYDAKKCRVRDIYDAFVSRYNLAWVQDENTGVVWFYPVEQKYEDILSAKINVTHDYLGLPMQTGVLEPLEIVDSMSIVVKKWGSLFLNTFNYAVDVPAGEYTVRDIINLCCIANPTKTFSVQANQNGFFITAVNLVAEKPGPIPAGVNHLWDVAAERSGQGARTRERLIAALATLEQEVRYGARNYLESVIWRVRADELIACESSIVQKLWTCIGITSILVRTEQATHLMSIETMRRLATTEFLFTGEPEIAVMTALDLARLTKDSSALEIVIKRDLAENFLKSVIRDICRVAALSEFVRKTLREMKADNLIGFSKPLTAIVQSYNAVILEF